MTFKKEMLFLPWAWLLLGVAGAVWAIGAVEDGWGDRKIIGVAVAILAAAFLLGSVVLYTRRPPS